MSNSKNIQNEAKEFNDLHWTWYSRLDTSMFDDLESDVIEALNSKRTSTRGINKERLLELQRLCVRQLLSALYQAYYTLPIGSKTVSVNRKESEYTGTQYSYNTLIEVLDTIQALHLIKDIEGVQNKRVSRIYPSPRLELFFNSVGLRWSKMIPNPSDALVVLRDLKHPNSKNPKTRRKKLDLPVPESKEVEQYRHNLYRINEVLTSHCISLDLDDHQLLVLANELAGKKKDEEGNAVEDEDSVKPINFLNVQLRRIFSRGSMVKGGRFYGGWWQGLPSLYRAHILIDGYKTAEVDYGTISLRILYAQIGMDIALETDLYDIGLDNWLGTKDPRREHIKTYINAAINDPSGNFRLKTAEQEALGITHEELKGQVLAAHKPIADQFSSGAGLDTQFIDSQIAEQVMLRMADEGHVVLPIHDSFIVRLGYEYRLREIMLEVFEGIIGARVKVAADYPRLRRQFGLEQAVVDKENDDPSLDVVGLSAMGEEFFSDSIMNRFNGF